MTEPTEANRIVANEDDPGQAISTRLAELSFVPAPTNIDLSRTDTCKLPFDMLPSMGVGIASLPNAFLTFSEVAKTSADTQLFQAVLPDGATLKQARDGLFSSAATLPDGSAAWANFQAVDNIGQTPTVIPYDPTALAMAVALAQINKKLDTIQDSLNKILDHLRLKDRASVRASLETLASIFNDYKHNWENPRFKQAKYLLVQSINRDAQQQIIELRTHALIKTEKTGTLELRNHASKSVDEILDDLNEYQLALYAYSFSTFLEVMLLENYDASYLESQAASIRQKALEYRETYTACFNSIESRTINSVVLNGLSSTIAGLGKMIEKTPIGDATQIDEALVDLGSGINAANAEENDRITERLVAVKDPAVIPFATSIDSVNSAYNQPCQLLTDGETLYVVPESIEQHTA